MKESVSFERLLERHEHLMGLAQCLLKQIGEATILILARANIEIEQAQLAVFMPERVRGNAWCSVGYTMRITKNQQEPWKMLAREHMGVMMLGRLTVQGPMVMALKTAYFALRSAEESRLLELTFERIIEFLEVADTFEPLGQALSDPEQLLASAREYLRDARRLMLAFKRARLEMVMH